MGSGNKPVLSTQNREEVEVQIIRMNERSMLFSTAYYLDIRNLQRIYGIWKQTSFVATETQRSKS